MEDELESYCEDLKRQIRTMAGALNDIASAVGLAPDLTEMVAISLDLVTCDPRNRVPRDTIPEPSADHFEVGESSRCAAMTGS